MKGTYRTDPSTEAQVTVVETGDGRHFLVARFKLREWKTLVFQHEVSPDCWISRRDIDGYLDAQDAVTGYLLRQPVPDPVSRMKRDLELAQRSNWALRDELMKLKACAAAGRVEKRRGVNKRGRRNT